MSGALQRALHEVALDARRLDPERLLTSSAWAFGELIGSTGQVLVDRHDLEELLAAVEKTAVAHRELSDRAKRAESRADSLATDLRWTERELSEHEDLVVRAREVIDALRRYTLELEQQCGVSSGDQSRVLHIEKRNVRLTLDNPRPVALDRLPVELQR